MEWYHFLFGVVLFAGCGAVGVAIWHAFFRAPYAYVDAAARAIKDGGTLESIAIPTFANSDDLRPMPKMAFANTRITLYYWQELEGPKNREIVLYCIKEHRGNGEIRYMDGGFLALTYEGDVALLSNDLAKEEDDACIAIYQAVVAALAQARQMAMQNNGRAT